MNSHHQHGSASEPGADPIGPAPGSSVAGPDGIRTRPRPDDIMGVAEVAAYLGLPRERVRQLAWHPDFPDPLARLATGWVWWRPDIEWFAKLTR